MPGEVVPLLYVGKIIQLNDSYWTEMNLKPFTQLKIY